MTSQTVADQTSFDQTTMRQASAMRAIFNDLKRDVATAAKELDLDVSLVSNALAGDRTALDLTVLRAIERWPVAARDLAPSYDDAPDGCLIWSAKRSANSARVLARAGRPYYEYRDTAMSRLSPFRPEWIKTLVNVESCDAAEPALRWNRGHGLHQLTFFLGAVNFFYEEDGKRVGREMNEGDSAFIPSWIPHTFAGRGPTAEAAILAVTFSGRLTGDVLEDLTTAFTNLRPDDLFDRKQPTSWFARSLQAKLHQTSMSIDHLVDVTGLDAERLSHFCNGKASAETREVETIAAALSVAVEDLLPPVLAPAHVLIKRACSGQGIPYPSNEIAPYSVKPMIASKLTPDARGVELTIENRDRTCPLATHLRFGLHQYAFVLGNRPVNLTWWRGSRRFDESLSPGDSFYMKPWTRHAFATGGGSGASASLCSFRCAGAFGREEMRELSALGKDALEKFSRTQTAWHE